SARPYELRWARHTGHLGRPYGLHRRGRVAVESPRLRPGSTFRAASDTEPHAGRAEQDRRRCDRACIADAYRILVVAIAPSSSCRCSAGRRSRSLVSAPGTYRRPLPPSRCEFPPAPVPVPDRRRVPRGAPGRPRPAGFTPTSARSVGVRSAFPAGTRIVALRLTSVPQAKKVLRTVHGLMPPWPLAVPERGPVLPEPAE